MNVLGIKIELGQWSRFILVFLIKSIMEKQRKYLKNNKTIKMQNEMKKNPKKQDFQMTVQIICELHVAKEKQQEQLTYMQGLYKKEKENHQFFLF